MNEEELTLVCLLLLVTGGMVSAAMWIWTGIVDAEFTIHLAFAVTALMYSASVLVTIQMLSEGRL